MRSILILPVVSFVLLTQSVFSQDEESREETVPHSNIIESPAGNTATQIPIKIRQASVNALLIREITSNNYGATVSKLTASVLPSSNIEAPMGTLMNQDVGESMTKSFSAVNKGMFIKYSGWPKGEGLTVGFADKHGGKDGPSAAVAYALLLESIFSGNTLRDDIACTGDMNSDRTVQPIGGVIDKIRAAKKGGCNYVLIPEKNVPAVMDAAIDGEIELLTSIQIISIKDLDQASLVAFKDIDEETTAALAAYEKVQKAVEAKGQGVLKNSQVFKQVGITGRTMKNHQSAIVAARYKLDKLPQTYSVIGSFNRIDKALEPYFGGKHTLGSITHSDRNDSHQVTIKNIGRLRNKLHPKMKDYAKKVKDFIEVQREVLKHKNGINSDGYLHKEYKKALEEMKEEQKKMYEDPEIKDSLM